jgi:hypothetical protein
MKFDSARFAKNQMLQPEEMGVIELSLAELETVYGGGNCPGSNGFPYGGNPLQGPDYNYGWNPSQGPGYSYGGSPDNGYGNGNGFSQLPPSQVPPPPCPYSY